MGEHNERAAEVLEEYHISQPSSDGMEEHHYLGCEPSEALAALSAAGLTVVDAGKVEALEELVRLFAAGFADDLDEAEWIESGREDEGGWVYAIGALCRPLRDHRPDLAARLSETLGDDQ